MADPALVKILRQGSETWNIWRKQHEEISRMDLSDTDLSDINLTRAYLRGAYLSDTNLTGADLSSAYLSQADMRRTDLTGADLSRAYLSGADLMNADLRGASLIGTNLSTANLSEARLNYADLSFANLNHANLTDTDLTDVKLTNLNLKEATMRDTVIARVDLCSVKGLAEIIHLGPSRVELHTIQLPQDGSTLHFLRGTGVPEEWIDFYRSQTMHPIQYHSCFISYAHQDESLARRLHSDLQDKGVRCWFAPHDMKIGDKIRPRINEAIHLQDKLLLILSEHSVASDWVEHEVETALAKEHRDKRAILFPIRLDNAILESRYTGWPALIQHQRHIGDFTHWKDHDQYQIAFDRLLRDLKRADE